MYLITRFVLHCILCVKCCVACCLRRLVLWDWFIQMTLTFSICNICNTSVLNFSLGSSLFTINNIVRSCTKRINSPFELGDVSIFIILLNSNLLSVQWESLPGI
jgi:hypothetical protein